VADTTQKTHRILSVATQGTGGDDEARILALLEKLSPEVFQFQYSDKKSSFVKLLRRLLKERPDLVVLEGTGVGGGVAVILARVLAGIPYVVSSGDAVGPFVAAQSPLLGPILGIYERLLCRCAHGFIGWTPYLTGRALTLGAPRSMTAAGWAPFIKSSEELEIGRKRIRDQLKISDKEIVVGIAGSLAWNPRVGYCYGYELVEAMKRIHSKNIRALIVGDGSGRTQLESLTTGARKESIILTGRVPRNEVPDYLAAMDIASLPQSTDQVGSFRYSTKVSEYLASRVPIVTSQIPLAYDFDGRWIWRLPGQSPWDPKYISALAELLDHVTFDEIKLKRGAIPVKPLPEFVRDTQVERVTQFIGDILRQPR
jgi:hypothetical protein